MTTFIDKTRVFLKAGSGGRGCMSFRREKFIPFGGPNGGNGGKGGDIYLTANPNLSTLIDVTYKPHYEARSGEPGQTWDKYGKSGEDLDIHLPCGTMVYKNKSFFADLSVPYEKMLVCKGGRGGRGNAAFKTQRQTAPRIAENGQPGEECTLDLELKTIADIGLVGYPNAGKSTFLSAVSNAHPKIADYPFTTLSPNLGKVTHKGVSFVIADIPGLIDDAHKGKGLGFEFLRHVERTKALIHIVDIFGFKNESAFENWKAILKELKEYGHDVDRKPYVLCLNKIDLTESAELVKDFEKQLKKQKKKSRFDVFHISAVSGKGIKPLLDKIIQIISKARTEGAESGVVSIKEGQVKRYTYEPDFYVEVMEGVFIVKGKKVEDLAAMTNFAQEQSVMRFQNILKKIGLEKELFKRGIKPGDTVKIGSHEFKHS